MATKTSSSDLAVFLPGKPAGPRGTPSAAPAGLALPRRPRRLDPEAAAVRPPSLSRFPGLLHPHSSTTLGGTTL